MYLTLLTLLSSLAYIKVIKYTGSDKCFLELGRERYTTFWPFEIQVVRNASYQYFVQHFIILRKSVLT
jgi:hypothetical protein